MVQGAILRVYSEGIDSSVKLWKRALLYNPLLQVSENIPDIPPPRDGAGRIPPECCVEHTRRSSWLGMKRNQRNYEKKVAEFTNMLYAHRYSKAGKPSQGMCRSQLIEAVLAIPSHQ